ncbi:MAG: hypothetical protein ACJ8GN_12955 [Longimicrobiaceae bacterium]
MKSRRIHALAVVTLLAASAACDSATGPAADPTARPEAIAEHHKLLGTITCHVDEVAGTTRCGELASASGARATRVILNTSHFTLVTVGSFYNGGTQQHTFFNQIRNDIGQAIGTHNGFTTDSIRAFVTAINVTGGSGSITANNPTGTATFTAANQPYWEYREIVAPSDQSSSVTWIFNVPSTVTAWSYTIGVSAPIQHPNGWIDVSGDTQIPHSGAREHTAVVHTWTGAVDNSGSVSWSSTDEGGYVSVSSLDERVGYVLGVRLGYATVTASKGSATPRTRTVEVY